MGTSAELDNDKLGIQLQEEIDAQLKELETLRVNRRNIGNPRKLSESISQIVWERFVLQIAGQAGKDFIRNNHDLKLSLRRADHYLNSDSFVDGKVPSHNFNNAKEYQERYDEWRTNFKENDPNKGIVRDAFDKNRPTGTASMAKDHTIPVKEILTDKDVTTYLSQEDKVKFANDTDVNLKDLDSAANASKGDKKMAEWLDSERDGKKPEERFNINRKELEERDAYAREKEQELIDKNKSIAEEEGKASRRAEALRSVGFTTQAVAMALFAKLTRTVFQELIRWFGEKDRKISSFFEHLKKAILEFLKDFKNNILMSIDVGVTVLLTQIMGEIVPMIRKALLFFKVGGKCFIDVSKYLKNPENAKKETSVKVMEIGKIVIASMTTAGAIGLGMAITGVLEFCVPALSVQIPLLGSPASLLGIFFGGLTAGICGAIVLKRIDEALENRQISDNVANQMVAQNGVLALQNQQFSYFEKALENASSRAAINIKDNMQNAKETMEDAKESIGKDRASDNQNAFDKIASMLDDLD